MTQSAPSVVGDPQDTAPGPNDAAAASQPSRLRTDPDLLADEIAALPSLDLYALRVRWRKLLRKPAPEHLGRAILIRVIAYRMQARVHGDLDPESVRALERIARDHDRRRKAGLHRPKVVPEVAPVADERGHKPGTMFIREHGGEMHRVTVTRDGFEWQGEIWRSLSEIARQITGTTWSGPKFFGLREPVREKREPPRHAAPNPSAVPAQRGTRSRGAETVGGPASGAAPGSGRSRTKRRMACDDRVGGAAS